MPHDCHRHTGHLPQRATRAGEAQDICAWSTGIRSLYDAVVQEPLPDGFRNLLEKMKNKADEPR